MKDIVIKSGTIKRELIVFLICFIFAFLMNAFAINRFGTAWSELFTQLGYVTVIAIVVYLLLAIVRGIICLIIMPFRRKKGKK